MTDAMGALVPLASCDCPERGMALAEFYERWQDDRQVVDKWFSVQATSTLPETLDGGDSDCSGIPPSNSATRTAFVPWSGLFPGKPGPFPRGRTAPATVSSPTSCCASSR